MRYENNYVWVWRTGVMVMGQLLTHAGMINKCIMDASYGPEMGAEQLIAVSLLVMK